MSYPKLLIATRNRGKMLEFSELLRDLPLELVSLNDLGVTEDVEETGHTFHENAALKARTYASLAGLMALADDSGLEVDALGGEPGVLSARYGEELPTGSPSHPMSDQDRVALLLKNLNDVPWGKRTARFRCVICIAKPSATGGGFEIAGSVVGSVAGMIQYEAQGEDGFGYDPVFYLPSYGMTMAQISLEEKNRISHRADASRRARPLLQILAASG